jgi:hypothetical protein
MSTPESELPQKAGRAAQVGGGGGQSSNGCNQGATGNGGSGAAGVVLVWGK